MQAAGISPDGQHAESHRAMEPRGKLGHSFYNLWGTMFAQTAMVEFTGNDLPLSNEDSSLKSVFEYMQEVEMIY